MKLKCTKFLAGVPPQTPLGELIAGFQGRGKGRGGNVRSGKESREPTSKGRGCEWEGKGESKGREVACPTNEKNRSMPL